MFVTNPVGGYGIGYAIARSGPHRVASWYVVESMDRVYNIYTIYDIYNIYTILGERGAARDRWCTHRAPAVGAFFVCWNGPVRKTPLGGTSDPFVCGCGWPGDHTTTDAMTRDHTIDYML